MELIVLLDFDFVRDSVFYLLCSRGLGCVFLPHEGVLLVQLGGSCAFGKPFFLLLILFVLSVALLSDQPLGLLKVVVVLEFLQLLNSDLFDILILD